MADNPKIFYSPFNEYTVTAVIGEGGSGRVFGVKDAEGKSYALKCLFAERVSTEKRKRFKNEIDFCRKHQHPNVIQVTDTGFIEWNKQRCPFYVMPFYPLTLRAIIDKGLPPDKVLQLFSQILDGVEAAHLHGVIHRDIKPENILSDESRTSLAVADFGIAHFEEDIIATLINTKPGDRLANLRYSAPEQREKRRPVDLRADIFALGLILNEMFTRSVPQGTGYVTIGTVDSKFGYLDLIVEKMIQHNPDARPATIEDIKKELIGRQNEFVALQKLDAKRSEVVPDSTPPVFEPIQLVGVDWNQGKLVLQISLVPGRHWIERFKSPREGYSSIVGVGPTNFHFQERTVFIPTEERLVQQTIDHFKRYIEMANRGYSQDLKNQARSKEAHEREKLKQEVMEAERRARILQNVKL